MANSADLDQMPHSTATDLGLQFLLRRVCPDTQGKYGTFTLFRVVSWEKDPHRSYGERQLK